jgi:hypothetical protein
VRVKVKVGVGVGVGVEVEVGVGVELEVEAEWGAFPQQGVGKPPPCFLEPLQPLPKKAPSPHQHLPLSHPTLVYTVGEARTACCLLLLL